MKRAYILLTHSEVYTTLLIPHNCTHYELGLIIEHYINTNTESRNLYFIAQYYYNHFSLNVDGMIALSRSEIHKLNMTG